MRGGQVQRLCHRDIVHVLRRGQVCQHHQQKQLCTSCQAGSFANSTAMSACLLCPVGTRSDEEAATSSSKCLSCGAGRAAPSPGMSVCSECEAGTYTNGFIGFAECAACEPGRYSDANSSTICLECPNSTFANSSGNTVCVLCEGVRLSNSLGSNPDHQYTRVK